MAKPSTNYKWKIVALLFFATTVNYIDRNTLSFIITDETFKAEMLGLAPNSVLSATDESHFKELLGKVDAVFKIAYGLGFILMGWLIDKIGLKLGYGLSILMWVGSSIFHAFVSSISSLSFARFGLGIGEAGNFPSAIKAVAEYFPKEERSKATGIFNAGANIGIIFTAFTVPLLLSIFGNWRIVFFVTGALGIILLLLWLFIYKKPSETLSNDASTTDASLAFENSKKLSWGKLLGYKQTWAFASAKFMTDCIWWFYLFWLPTFFKDSGIIDMKANKVLGLGLPILIIYLVSDVGSIFFGWLSTYFIKNGMSVNKGRKLTMLICGLCVAPIFFTALVPNIYLAVVLISLAAGAHQGWSANLFTLVSDMFPKHSISSVVGIGGMFGAIGGALFQYYSGYLINSFGFIALFVIASVAYLVALGLVQLLSPQLKSIEIK